MKRMEGWAHTSAELQRELTSLTQQLAQPEGRLSGVVKEVRAYAAKAAAQGQSTVREPRQQLRAAPEEKDTTRSSLGESVDLN